MIAIIGSGPSALLLAHYLKQHTIKSIIIDIKSSLHCTYGVWENEIAPWARDIIYASTYKYYPEIMMNTDDKTVTNPYPYLLLDNDALLAHLSVNRITARVESIEQLPQSSPNPYQLHLTNKYTLTADLVIDATGSLSTFQQYPSFEPSYQSFYGATVKFKHPHKVPLGRVELMDFSHPYKSNPTFCYTLPQDAHELFMEETVLNGPILSPVELKRRLIERIDRRFPNNPYELSNIESDDILMNSPEPLFQENAPIPFGAAAGMICPHTGYMVGYLTQMVQKLGDAIVADKPHETLYRTIYNKSHADKLHAGMALTRFDGETLGSFMVNLFSLPRKQFFKVFFHSSSTWQFRFMQLRMTMSLPFKITKTLVQSYIIHRIINLLKYFFFRRKQTVNSLNFTQPTMYVIGGGISGLSTACYLAKKYKVVLLEKNPRMGGRMDILKSPDERYHFDKGPSWLWMPDIWEDFFKDFGYDMNDYLDFESLDPQYRMYFPGRKYMDVPTVGTHYNPQSIETAIQTFINGLKIVQIDIPDSQIAISQSDKNGVRNIIEESTKQYHVMLLAMQKNVLNIFALATYSIIKTIRFRHLIVNQQQEVNRHIRDSCLRSLLAWPVLFVGGRASDVPYLFNLLNYSATIQGTFYPRHKASIGTSREPAVKTGMFCLSQCITELAAHLGVELRNNVQVDSCELNAVGIAKQHTGKIQSLGVSTESGSSQIKLNPNDKVILAGDYHHFDQSVMPQQYREYSPEYWDNMTMGPSSLLIYWGFNFNNCPADLNVQERLKALPHHTLFFDSNMDHHMDCVYKNHSEEPNPLFYINRVSAGDDTVAPPGCETMFVLIPSSPNLEFTDQYKQEMRDYVVNRMSTEYLGVDLAPYIEFEHLYDRQSFIDDYFSFKGNAYGSANTLKQFASLRPRMRSKKVSNLFYTGQLTYPGGGLPTCLVSGRLVADIVVDSMETSRLPSVKKTLRDTGIAITDKLVSLVHD